MNKNKVLFRANCSRCWLRTYNVDPNLTNICKPKECPLKGECNKKLDYHSPLGHDISHCSNVNCKRAASCHRFRKHVEAQAIITAAKWEGVDYEAKFPELFYLTYIVTKPNDDGESCSAYWPVDDIKKNSAKIAKKEAAINDRMNQLLRCKE